ncbi:uracil-DNA glycosylase [Planctomonas sp. JC2975]|nr:uracil-DNA glycosylase [Planctomonas sp. JC2975]NNC12400.1 uracil-DNA glycosylase [Planctomonas sp. JC2975]
MAAEHRRSELTPFLAALDALAADVPDDAEFLYDPSTPRGALRRGNLLHYLALMAEIRPKVLLLAEAPGYRGMTVSGVPFTSVRQLTTRPGLITGRAEGDGFEVPEHPDATWESSSGIVWRALQSWRGPLPLLWGVYPNHPFVPGDRLTNRAPRPAEVRAGAPVALALAEAFGIGLIAAVGRKAQGAMASAGVDAPALRHPAQGGATIFTQQVHDLNERMLTS